MSFPSSVVDTFRSRMERLLRVEESRKLEVYATTGLALAVGDFYLPLKALVIIAISVIAAVLFGTGTVWVLPLQSVTPEIVSRTAPNLLDLWVAIFSGLAGAIVTCRGGGAGGMTALPGVAIAVALQRLESLARQLQGLGVSADRIQAVKPGGRDNRVWALMEERKT